MAKTSGEIEREFIDTLRQTTGKDLKAWLSVVRKSGIEKRNDIISFLKKEEGFGHMNASLLAGLFLNDGKPVYGSEADLLENQFAGKEHMRGVYDSVIAFVRNLFRDARVLPKKTYVSIMSGKEFAAINIKSGEVRLGLDLGQAPFTDALQKSRLTGPMPRISHMVVISETTQLDKKLEILLRQSLERVNL